MVALPQTTSAYAAQSLRTRQFTSTADLTSLERHSILDLAAYGKKTRWSEFRSALARKVVGLLFFNPSLRTRITFEVGIQELGGYPVVLAPGNDSWSIEFADGAVMNGDKTEHVRDAIKVMERHFSAICVRSFAKLKSWSEDEADTVIDSFRRHSSIPLISMESALWHPCQALADALTLKETFGERTSGKTLVLSWAPHPKQLPMAVPNSTLLMAAELGMNVRLACPKDYCLSDSVMALAERSARDSGGSLEIFADQDLAMNGADVVYAKSWTPPGYIGQAEREAERRQSLTDWTLSRRQLASSNSARLLHCLPVRRNVEVTDELLDDPNVSLTIEEAENRRHVQNALMVSMLGER